MRKLLSAGFARLWKNGFFWGEVVIMDAFMVYLLIVKYREQAEYNSLYSLDLFVPAAFMFIGIFIAMFAALFLGTEHSDGTIRNKLVMGHGRSAVYLSALLICLSASVIMYLSSLAVILIVGIPLFGFPAKPLLYTLGVMGMGIMVMAAFSGIFTLIALLSTNKAVSSTLCILGFFLLVIATVYVNERLSAPEMIGGAYELTEEGEVRLCDPYPNPGYVEGATRDFFQFVIDFLPTGQGFQMSEAGTEKGMELRPVLYLYSSMIAAATTVLGIVIFRKKDLK